MQTSLTIFLTVYLVLFCFLFWYQAQIRVCLAGMVDEMEGIEVYPRGSEVTKFPRFTLEDASKGIISPSSHSTSRLAHSSDVLVRCRGANEQSLVLWIE